MQAISYLQIILNESVNIYDNLLTSHKVNVFQIQNNI